MTWRRARVATDRHLLLATLLAGLLLAFPACAPPDGADVRPHDLVVLDGRVMDPASGTDSTLNVGIRDGRIAALSSDRPVGRDTIDASGLVVAPGFVDLHEHGARPEAYRLMVRDGVTTALELEVGTDSVAAWYAERAAGRTVNYGVSVGHIPVRMTVMDDPGEFLPSGPAAAERATGAQLAEMERRIREGLAQGAVAVGFGTAYTPGAPMSEVTRMMEVAAGGASVHVHLRGGVAGLDSTLAAARSAGVPLHVVHVNSSAGDSLRAFLRLIRAAREAGQDVTTETYPYGAGMTRIESALFDDWREWADSAFGRYQWMATGERMTRESFAEARAEGGFVIIHSRTEAQTRAAVTSPLTMIASDGGLTEGGHAHPRIAGSYSKVLGRYVREEGELSLMEALAKMTVRPARRLQSRVPAMERKGRVQVGADADLTLFDPETVRDRATYTEPKRPPEGVPHVIVAGVPVVRDGGLVEGARPGGPVRAPHPGAGTEP